MKHFLCTTGIFVLTMSFSFSQNSSFEVSVIGKGRPILMIPGFTCPAEVWSPSVDLLKNDYEIHLFTLAGFGDVPPIDFPWLSQVKEGLVAYVLENKLQGATIIGHSMGGTLGLWIAATHPDLLGKIIDVDGLPAMGALMFPNYNPENFAYESPYNAQILAMSDKEFEQMANGFANGMTLKPEKRDILAQWIKTADRKTYVYGYTDLLQLDLREKLSEIKIPVTVIAATQPYGEATVKENISKQFENLGSYDLILAKNAAHFIMFDQPVWFNQQLEHILKN